MPYDKIKKILKLERQAGMSYVELIVVLSIFSLLSGIVIYNYGGFQARVDLKNLTSDIALKIVEAQDSSLSGKLPSFAFSEKPSYGVYFKDDDQKFFYFADLNNNEQLDDVSCTDAIGECLETISIPKNFFIDSIGVLYLNSTILSPQNDITINFSRPSSSAVFYTGSDKHNNVDYVQINVKSPNSQTAFIKVYPSGRIQLR